MKKRISITNIQAPNYLFNRFLKQFKTVLEENQIGEMLTCSQVLSVLVNMNFVDEDPLPQDIQLSKTITKMLTSPNIHSSSSVTRHNLFKFLALVCDIQESKQSWENSYFQEQISGLALDQEWKEEPLIIIKIGDFDEYGRWSCNEMQKEQIKEIFKSMKLKKISRGEAQIHKKSGGKKEKQKAESFKPKICLKSSSMVEQKLKIKNKEKEKVQNRLLQSREVFKSKIANQASKSKQKELKQCTFKPRILSKSKGKQNIRSNSQEHLKKLFDKKNLYENKKKKLQEVQIKLNESVQLQECTFKPTLYKQPQSTKWVYVRNRQKQIDRLRKGRQQRQFVNNVKQRGYPSGVGWCEYMNNSKQGKEFKHPILCIDLKILNQKNNINVYQGDNLMQLAEKISKQNKVPEGSWWKVEQLIKKAIEHCPDVLIDGNKIYSSNIKV